MVLAQEARPILPSRSLARTSRYARIRALLFGQLLIPTNQCVDGSRDMNWTNWLSESPAKSSGVGESAGSPVLSKAPLGPTLGATAQRVRGEAYTPASPHFPDWPF